MSSETEPNKPSFEKRMKALGSYCERYSGEHPRFNIEFELAREINRIAPKNESSQVDRGDNRDLQHCEPKAAL